MLPELTDWRDELALIAGGRLAVVASGDSGLSVWNLATRKQLLSLPLAGFEPPWRLWSDPAGSVVYLSNAAGALQSWDFRSLEEIHDRLAAATPTDVPRLVQPVAMSSPRQVENPLRARPGRTAAGLRLGDACQTADSGLEVVRAFFEGPLDGVPPSRFLEMANRYVALAGEDPRAWTALGHAEFNRGRFPEARAAGRRALQLAPDAGLERNGALLLLARVASAQGDARDFEEVVGEWLTSWNTLADWHLSLIRLQAQQGRYADALSTALTALGLPDSPQLPEGVRDALTKDSQALRALVGALKQAPSLPLASPWVRRSGEPGRPRRVAHRGSGRLAGRARAPGRLEGADDLAGRDPGPAARPRAAARARARLAPTPGQSSGRVLESGGSL